jgi:hypothetical protein
MSKELEPLVALQVRTESKKNTIFDMDQSMLALFR